MAMCHLKVMEEFHSLATREHEFVMGDVAIEPSSADKCTLGHMAESQATGVQWHEWVSCRQQYRYDVK